MKPLLDSVLCDSNPSKTIVCFKQIILFSPRLCVVKSDGYQNQFDNALKELENLLKVEMIPFSEGNWFPIVYISSNVATRAKKPKIATWFWPIRPFVTFPSKCSTDQVVAAGKRIFFYLKSNFLSLLLQFSLIQFLKINPDICNNMLTNVEIDIKRFRFFFFNSWFVHVSMDVKLFSFSSIASSRFNFWCLVVFKLFCLYR